jgi:transcriptional regulator with XRE-family HTH domain
MSPEQVPGKIGKFVGERLRELRTARNFTQSQLASPDFSISYISAIERGQIRPSLRALEIFAQRLGVPSTYFLPQQQDVGGANPLFEGEEDEVEYLLLHAHIAILQGAAAQASNQLEAAEVQHWPPLQLLRYHYLLGWSYLASRRLEQSEQQLNKALEIANTLHASFPPRVLALLGLTYAAMRDFRQAIASHRRCLTLLEELKPSDTALRAQVSFYLGQHYLAQAHTEQADEMLRAALALFATLESPQARQTYYTESMQHALEANAPDQFLLSAHEALSLSMFTALAQQRSMLYYQLGELLLQHDMAAADSYLTTALERAIAEHDDLSIASLSLHKARVELSRQASGASTGAAPRAASTTTDDAQTTANKYIQYALSLIAGQSDSLIHALVLLTSGELAYEQRNYEEGDSQLTTGLDMLHRLGALNEYAHHAVRYAQLLEQRGLYRESLIYYKRAYQQDA